jgi:hypothetical protein
MDDIAFPGGKRKHELNKLLYIDDEREPIDPHAPWVWRHIWSTLKSSTLHWLGLDDGGVK